MNGYEFTLDGRAQWVGLAGAPVTGNFTAAIPLNSINSGVGFLLIQDYIGNSSTTTIKGQYAYHLALAGGTLSAGLNAGFVQYLYQNPQTPNTPITRFDLDAGAYYHTDNFFAGLSATHLAEPTYDNYQSKMHLFLTSGYKVNISQMISTEPSLLFKTDFAFSQLDINNFITYNEVFILGTGWRFQDAVIFSAGIKLGVFQMLYAYDMTTSQMKYYSNGSHEINLKITINNNSNSTTPS